MSTRRRSRASESFTGLSEPPKGQGIHVYLFWTKDGERYLSHNTGEVTAEELCISAAETVGEHKSLNKSCSPEVKVFSLSCGIWACWWQVCVTSAFSYSGITPLCHVLFALYNPQTCCWYSPNHIFKTEENTSLVLHYCMRLVCISAALYLWDKWNTVRMLTQCFCI